MNIIGNLDKTVLMRWTSGENQMVTSGVLTVDPYVLMLSLPVETVRVGSREVALSRVVSLVPLASRGKAWCGRPSPDNKARKCRLIPHEGRDHLWVSLNGHENTRWVA